MAHRHRTYQPRDTQHAARHAVVREHLEPFLREAWQRGDGHGLPRFVEQEFATSSPAACSPTVSRAFGAPTAPFPPGTSKWNKIEHRLFSFISQNWRGKPLITHEVIVKLIASTTTTTGLRVRSRLDTKSYPAGVKVSRHAMDALSLRPESFHGDWNYTIQPLGHAKRH